MATPLTQLTDRQDPFPQRVNPIYDPVLVTPRPLNVEVENTGRPIEVAFFLPS
jgi:hypothetical protein